MNATTNQVSARLVKAGFGLLLMAMGGLFVWLMASSYSAARATHGWPETPCHIVRSEVEAFHPTPHSPETYRFDVEFTYSYGGRQLTSTHRRVPRRNEWTTRHRSKAEALAEKFPAGADTVCYVDPDNPELAVLERSSKAPLYAIWFPVLFVAGGAGIVIGALRKPGARVTNSIPE